MALSIKGYLMIGYIVLIIIVYLSFKYSFKVKRNMETFKENGMSTLAIYLLNFSSLLYIISILAFIFPISWLTNFLQLFLAYLLILPSIYLGYVISSKMEKVGLELAAKGARIADAIMWLGVGLSVFITGNRLVELVLIQQV